MPKLQPNGFTRRAGRRAVNPPNKSALLLLAALVALALCALARAADAGAQSRRAPRPAATPTPSPTPEATPEGESESQPRGTRAKEPAVLVSLVLMEYDNPMMGLDYGARDDIWHEFTARLGKSRAVSVTQGGKGSRGEARSRAKSESAAYVVLFEMEDEGGSMGDTGMGRADSRNLLLRTFVYAPKTGDLKFTDTVYQRPYRDSTTIGGVRVPLPTGTGRVERYPSQRQLEQAARDAADRLLSRFDVILPPDN